MKKLFTAMESSLSSGRDCVLVTIVASSGSTPRGAGARLLLLDDGSFAGTIGGGSVEFAALEEAKRLLSLRQDGFKGYNLGVGEVESLGMVCGGRVSVCFQFVPGGDGHMLELCSRALDLLAGNEDAWIISDITDERVNAIGLYTRTDGLWGIDAAGAESLVGKKAFPFELDGKRLFCEPLLQAGRVYVFGGGHVSRELVPALTRVGFRCVVYDDRPEFLTSGLFPDASELICGELTRATELLSLTESDYAVVMTRGHTHDYELQAQLLKTPVRYIGVIGSRSKVAFVSARLRDDGFTDEDIARITSPIGLSIGAETPAEIAVSIAAQLISVRSGARNSSTKP